MNLALSDQIAGLGSQTMGLSEGQRCAFSACSPSVKPLSHKTALSDRVRQKPTSIFRLRGDLGKAGRTVARSPRSGWGRRCAGRPPRPAPGWPHPDAWRAKGSLGRSYRPTVPEGTLFSRSLPAAPGWPPCCRLLSSRVFSRAHSFGSLRAIGNASSPALCGPLAPLASESPADLQTHPPRLPGLSPCVPCGVSAGSVQRGGGRVSACKCVSVCTCVCGCVSTCARGGRRAWLSEEKRSLLWFQKDCGQNLAHPEHRAVSVWGSFLANSSCPVPPLPVPGRGWGAGLLLAIPLPQPRACPASLRWAPPLRPSEQRDRSSRLLSCPWSRFTVKGGRVECAGRGAGAMNAVRPGSPQPAPQEPAERREPRAAGGGSRQAAEDRVLRRGFALPPSSTRTRVSGMEGAG